MKPKDLPSYLRPLFWLRNNFTRPAVEAAITDREESIPYLIAGIRYVCEEPDVEGPDGEAYMMHLFAMYLLAQFREESALPEVIRMVRLPEVEFLLEDSITEGLSQVLASVSGEKTEPIKGLVEDVSVYEFVRAAAFEALEIMRHDGRVDRDAEVVAPKISRNGPGPCGSGKKYKKCCI